jgi:hypothetical protein
MTANGKKILTPALLLALGERGFRQLHQINDPDIPALRLQVEGA